MILLRDATYQARLKEAFDRGKLEGQAGARNQAESDAYERWFGCQREEQRQASRYRAALERDAFIPEFIEHAVAELTALADWEKELPTKRELAKRKSEVLAFVQSIKDRAQA